jgi:hypothetical protein
LFWLEKKPLVINLESVLLAARSGVWVRVEFAPAGRGESDSHFLILVKETLARVSGTVIIPSRGGGGCVDRQLNGFTTHRSVWKAFLFKCDFRTDAKSELTRQSGRASAAGGGRFARRLCLHLLQPHLQVACVQEEEQGRGQRQQRQKLAGPTNKKAGKLLPLSIFSL